MSESFIAELHWYFSKSAHQVNAAHQVILILNMIVIGRLPFTRSAPTKWRCRGATRPAPPPWRGTCTAYRDTMARCHWSTCWVARRGSNSSVTCLRYTSGLFYNTIHVALVSFVGYFTSCNQEPSVRNLICQKLLVNSRELTGKTFAVALARWVKVVFNVLWNGRCKWGFVRALKTANVVAPDLKPSIPLPLTHLLITIYAHIKYEHIDF